MQHRVEYYTSNAHNLDIQGKQRRLINGTSSYCKAITALQNNVGKGGKEDLKLRPGLTVLRQQGHMQGWCSAQEPKPILHYKPDSITGRVRKSIRAISQLKQCLEYNYFLLQLAQSFIHTEQSILSLFNQSGTFVINNDLGSTFEACAPMTRWSS
jgi:hypothetical protein